MFLMMELILCFNKIVACEHDSGRHKPGFHIARDVGYYRKIIQRPSF